MEYAKKLDQIEVRFEELSQQLADPAIISDGDRYRKTAKAPSDMEESSTSIAIGSRGERSGPGPRHPYLRVLVPDRIQRRWRVPRRSRQRGDLGGRERTVVDAHVVERALQRRDTVRLRPDPRARLLVVIDAGRPGCCPPGRRSHTTGSANRHRSRPHASTSCPLVGYDVTELIRYVSAFVAWLKRTNTFCADDRDSS